MKTYNIAIFSTILAIFVFITAVFFPAAGIAQTEQHAVCGFTGMGIDGYNEVTWDGKNDFGIEVGSGTYFYQLKTSSKLDVKKMILIR